MSVQNIVRRVQVLWDAIGQNWCDVDYVSRFIQIYNEDLESHLEALGLSFNTKVLTLTNVPAGTKDLSAFQADGSALDDLVTPILIQWRATGSTDDTAFDGKEVPHVDKVLDQGPSPGPGIDSFEFRAGIIYLSPSSQALDLRIRYQALPNVLDPDSTNFVKGMANVIAYHVAEMIAATRGGEESKLVVYFASKGMKALDDLDCRLTKGEQNVKRRLGGRRRRGPFSPWSTFPRA